VPSLDKKAPSFFEGWARKNNMIPVGRYTFEEGDILVADSDEPFWGSGEGGTMLKFFRTGFAIFREQAWIASTHDYFVSEMGPLTKRGARDFRIKEALEYGQKYLQQTADAGLYDDGRKESFSKRPD